MTFTAKPDEAAMLLRRAEVLKHRLTGKSLRQIGALLVPPVSYETVRSDLATALAEVAEEAKEDADRLRALDLMRLDKAITVCLEFLEDEDLGASERMQATDKLCKIVERRAKLLGLDAPERHEDVTPGTMSPAAAAAVVREVFRNNVGTPASAPAEAATGAAGDAGEVPGSTPRA